MLFSIIVAVKPIYHENSINPTRTILVQGEGGNNSNEGDGANNGRRVFFIGGEVITLLAKVASIN